MKKIIVLVLLMVLLISATPWVKLMRLEVINKSEFPAQLRLWQVTYDQEQTYYLNVPEAGVTLPAVKLYTLVRGLYDVDASYCNQDFVTIFQNLDLTVSQFRITIPPCEQKYVVDSLPDGALKLNPQLYPPVDLFDIPIIYDLGGFVYRY